MGQRSATETLAGIYQAFLSRRVWKQADLARELGVSTEVVRRTLHELQEKGMPLERDDDDPPHVYWNVRKDWFPGSVLFKSDEIPDLLRQLRRVPHGQGRARLLALVLERLPSPAAIPTSPAVVVAREGSPQEDRYLEVVEDAANRRTTLHMRYLTAGRVDEGMRQASVHRVFIGPPARFAATCHRDGKLKTFRVDGILDARLESEEPFRPADDEVLDAYVKGSLDGFHDSGPASVYAFLVRNPEARWVKKNLLEGMEFGPANDGIRVTVSTAALNRLASYVVGLGAAATPETPALAREVGILARGALEAIASAGEQPRSRV